MMQVWGLFSWTGLAGSSSYQQRSIHRVQGQARLLEGGNGKGEGA